MSIRILIIEDEDIIRESMQEFLQGEGYEVETAERVSTAIRQVQEADFDIVVSDVQLPDGDGIGLFKHLQKLNPEMLGLIITAYATVENAIDAFKAGASDYLVKPVNFVDLAHKVKRLLQLQELHRENSDLRRELARQHTAEEIVGSSKAINELQATIQKIAVTNSNVLLVGETGTGQGTGRPRDSLRRSQEP